MLNESKPKRWSSPVPTCKHYWARMTNFDQVPRKYGPWPELCLIFGCIQRAGCVWDKLVCSFLRLTGPISSNLILYIWNVDNNIWTRHCRLLLQIMEREIDICRVQLFCCSWDVQSMTNGLTQSHRLPLSTSETDPTRTSALSSWSTLNFPSCNETNTRDKKLRLSLNLLSTFLKFAMFVKVWQARQMQGME